MTLRRRVLLYVASAALASCAITVAVAVLLVRQRIVDQRAAALERQAEVVATVGGAPGALGSGDHVYGVGSGRPRRLGPRRASLVLSQISAAGDGTGTITVAGRSVLYVARSTPAGRVVLVRSAQLAFTEWRPFVLSLVIAGLGGSALAAALSLLLARRVARPIAALALATERIADGETDVEVPLAGEDELAALGGSFNAMARQLASARAEQRSFLESVSHELKTPLTSIRGYAEAMGDQAVAPADAARVITAEAGRLERLVGDLLELARVGRADFSVALVPVDLGVVGARAVERHLPRAQELSVALSLAGPQSTASIWALGDEQRLLQATSNLIENALRLTPAGGSVAVSARAGGIEVADTGPGLTEEEIPHAFERFYLHDRHSSDRPVGSGLGLAIVHELMVAMGGSAEVSRSPAGGAAFILRLPLEARASSR